MDPFSKSMACPEIGAEGASGKNVAEKN